MNLQSKLAILADAAKYDASCASSGAAPRNSVGGRGMGSTESLTTNPEWATQFSVHQLVEKTGTQGVELLMWLAMRGALATASAGVRRVHSN